MLQVRAEVVPIHPRGNRIYIKHKRIATYSKHIKQTANQFGAAATNTEDYVLYPF